MLKSSLCDYKETYILATGIINITGDVGTPAARTKEQIERARKNDKRNKRVIFETCAPFTEYISEINIRQIDNAKDIDIVMLLYNLI